MNITFACYESLSLIHGGPRVQILQTKAELEKLGVRVTLLNPWTNAGRDTIGPVHLFSANIGTFHLASTFRHQSIPFVVSSIFFTRHSPFAVRSTIRANAVLKKFRTGIWTNYEYTRQVCNWAQGVLPNTTDEARLVTEGLGIDSKNVHIVPNGVEARFEHGDPALFKKKYGFENFILTVGHIGPARKNVLRLLQALRRIDHPAVIIGKVSDTAEGRACMDEAKKSKNILIIPGLENDSEMLASAYAACDVFALPSMFETPGIAALEAGLAGGKVVITPFGGTKDYFETMAEYVDPYDVESIAQGIRSALNAKKNSSLQQHIKKHFLWSTVAEQTLSVYKRIFA